MATTLNTYSGGGLTPAVDAAGALTLDVALPAGVTLTKGTVLGQVLGTGTAVNEVQTITPGGTVSGGTWQITYDGETTTALAFNANAAAVQAALEALPSIGVGGCTVAGGGLNTAAFTLTFAGANTTAGLHHPLVSVINSLTGTTPTATPTLTTLGKPANGYWDAYNDAASGSTAGLSTARAVLKYDARTDSNGRIYPGQTKNASDNSTFQRSVPAYYAGTFAGSDLTGLDANGVTDLGRLITGTTAALTDAKTLLRMG